MIERTMYPPVYGEDDAPRNQDRWYERREIEATHRDIADGMCRFSTPRRHQLQGFQLIGHLLETGQVRRGI